MSSERTTEAAIVEIRGLPAQAVAAVEISEQLRLRGFHVSFISGEVPAWFSELYPELSANTTIISERRVDARSLFWTPWVIIAAACSMIVRRASIRQSPMQFHLYGINVTDLILDSAIRSGGALASRLVRWTRIFFHSLIAAQILQRIDAMVKTTGATLVVTSSRSYVSVHGLLSRYGHESSLAVLNNAPTFVAFTLRNPSQFRIRDRGREDVVQFIESAKADSELQTRLNRFKSERFSIDSPNKDYRRAEEWHSQSAGGTGTNLGSFLTNVGQNRVIYIAPHVFSDAVHMEGPQLFRDYLAWFVATVKHIQAVPGAAWLTKTHPAAADYGEQHLIGQVLAKHDTRRRVTQLDPWTSPAEIVATADAVVTVRGTVGMEFGVHGKPAILCGSARYSHLGFTVSPTTKGDYFNVLSSLPALPALRVDPFVALASLYFFETQLIEANLPGSAFSQKSLNLVTADWRTTALALEDVRRARTDPFLEKVARVLDAGQAMCLYE